MNRKKPIAILLLILLLLSACTPAAANSVPEGSASSNTPVGTSSVAAPASSNTVSQATDSQLTPTSSAAVSSAPALKLTIDSVAEDAFLTFCDAAYIDKNGTVHVAPALLEATDYSASHLGKAYYDGWKALDGTENACALVLLRSEVLQLHNCCVVVLLADGTLVTSDLELNKALENLPIPNNIKQISAGYYHSQSSTPTMWVLSAITEDNACCYLQTYEHYDRSLPYEDLVATPRLEKDDAAAYAAAASDRYARVTLTTDGKVTVLTGNAEAWDGTYVQAVRADSCVIALQTNGALKWAFYTTEFGLDKKDFRLRHDADTLQLTRLFAFAPNWARASNGQIEHLRAQWTIPNSEKIVQLYEGQAERVYALYEDGHVELIKKVQAPKAMFDLLRGETPEPSFMDGLTDVKLP